MNHRVHIIGVGSPFGDDRFGWVAAETLRRSAVIGDVPAGRIEISILDRPGAMLPLRWRQTDIVILLDAVRSGATTGTRHYLDARDLSGAGVLYSSHGLGVVSAVELAAVLGYMPSRLMLRGMEVDASWTGFSLSPSVTATLPSFVAAVAQEALELASFCPPAAANRA